MNHSESTARALKASKLLWALEAQGKRVGIDPETVAGCNVLKELAARLGAPDWKLLASLAGTLPPSEETQALMLLLLDAKAASLFDAEPSTLQVVT